MKLVTGIVVGVLALANIAIAQPNVNGLSCQVSFCVACVPGNAQECSRCVFGMDLVDGKCLPQLPEVCNVMYCREDKCQDRVCSECHHGYYLAQGNGACVSCKTSYGQECHSCTSTQCTDCGHLQWDPQTKKCVAKQCTPNCADCDNGQCRRCETGFFKEHGTCKSCKSEYGNDCAACDSHRCTSCQNGSQWNEQQKKCVQPPPKTCDNVPACNNCDNGVCKGCENGYFLANGNCNSCNVYGSDCVACTSQQCTDCGSKVWSPSEKKCVEPPKKCEDPNCTTCVNGNCQACKSGFFRQGNECKPCMANCVECTAHNQCSQCSARHYYDKTQKKCLPCGSNCQTCQCKPLFGGCAPLVSECTSCVSDDYRPQVDGSCTACASDEYRDGNACKKCSSAIDNCNACTFVLGQVLCTSCSAGIVPACTLECEKCPAEHWRSGPFPCSDLAECKAWKVCEASKLQFEILPGTSWSDRQCLDVGKMLKDLLNKVVDEVKDIVADAEDCIRGGSRPCGCLQTASNQLNKMVGDYEKQLADLNKALDLASSIEEVKEIQKAIDVVIKGMGYAETALATVSNILGVLSEHKVC